MKKGMAVLVAVLLFAWGCAAGQQAAPDQPAAAKETTPNVVFYMFPDIPVPKELTLQRSKSFIYETPSLKAGVLVLSGNVDVGSLENYFRVNMAKNGWRLVNSYKFSDVILNFMKEDRASNIRTTRDAFTTQVEIWVGPVDRPVSGPGAPLPREADRSIPRPGAALPKGNDFR
ncbi:MAG: hypothetical protein ABSE25_03755 [Syntrophorhabdales bacterium]|jgi:hypothetical protein